MQQALPEAAVPWHLLHAYNGHSSHMLSMSSHCAVQEQCWQQSWQPVMAAAMGLARPKPLLPC